MKVVFRVATGIAAAIALAGLWLSPQAAASAWLAAYWFVLGPAVGALSLLLMVQLAGGAWAPALQPALRAAAAATPIVVLLGLPLLIGAPALYPWLGAGQAHAAQRWWLNPVTVGVSLLIAAVFWSWLARRLWRGPPSRAAAAGLAVAHLLVGSVVAIDLVMSLQPVFRSTSFGIEAVASQALAAMALALAISPPLGRRHAPAACGVLLMLAMLWTYLHFMAYLTIWTADLPAETAWVLPRTHTGWAAVTAFGALLQGPLPVLALAVPALRGGRGLKAVAVFVLLGSALFAQVQVGAASHLSGPVFGVFDVAAWFALITLAGTAVLRRFVPPEFTADAQAATPPPPLPPPRRPAPARRAKAAAERDDADDWQAEARWDISGRAAWRIAAGFVVVLVVLCGGLYGYWGVLFADEQRAGSTNDASLPPSPRLQTHAPQDREAVLAAQRQRLASYGWIDRQRGIARIPIARAMQLQAAENGS